MINIALIGAGAIDRIHTRNVSESAACSLTHVVDIDLAKAEDYYVRVPRARLSSLHPAGWPYQNMTGL